MMLHFASFIAYTARMDTLQILRQTLAAEREAIEIIEQKVGGEAVRAVELFLQCQGHVVITGIGKTGLIGRKIAATLTSTGTPAVFLHAAEAIHGDLGVIGERDVIVVLSNSGESGEIVALLPHLRSFGVPIIAMTGHTESTLARQSDVVLDVGVPSEAGPLGMAPTTSTTAALAMGDALAMAAKILRGFSKAAYGRFHPGGSLGRALLRVRDLMHSGGAVPLVQPDMPLREAIVVMSAKRLGAVFVADDGGPLLGIITDGDLRRILQREADPLNQCVSEVMVSQPQTVLEESFAKDALDLMESRSITILPVVNTADEPIAALHMHDLVRAGLATWTDLGD